MEETWKDIEGYEKLYQISSMGRVRSLDRTIISNNGVIRNIKGTVMSNILNTNGYLYVSLYNKGYRKTKSIHSLIAHAFIPNKENKSYINHIDSNPLNNSIDNLEWCTQSENVQHGYDYGNATIGESRYNSKLTSENVIEARKKYVDGMKNISELARIYRVSRTTMQDIINRKYWKHI